MNKLFEQIFRYGFHDTQMTSIDLDGWKIKLQFRNGVYLLDESGKEIELSKPIQMILKFNHKFNSVESFAEIREYGRNIRYLDLLDFKNILCKESFQITMVYYSNFSKSLLFDGGFHKKSLLLIFDEIEEIFYEDL